MQSRKPKPQAQPGPAFSDPEAEIAVLACCFLNTDAFHNLRAKLEPAHFASKKHALIYETVLAVHQAGSPINRINVANVLRANGTLEEAGGVAYLGELTRMLPLVEDWSAYAQILIDCHAKSRALEILRSGAAALKSSSADVDAAITPTVNALSQLIDTDTETPWVLDVLSRHELTVNGGLKHLPRWPVTWMDAVLEPMEGYLHVLAALSSHGKTALALDLMYRNFLLEAPVRCAFFSLEMSARQIVSRLVQTHTRIPARQAHQRHYAERWAEGVNWFHERGLIVHDHYRYTQFPNLLAKMESLGRRGQIRLIVIDYLMLLDHPAFPANAITERVRAITRALKQFTRRYGVDVLLLHQINKSAGRQSWRPGIADVEYGGEKDADSVLLLWRPENVFPPDHPEHTKQVPCPGYTEAYFVKNREGPLGSIVKLQHTPIPPEKTTGAFNMLELKEA